MSSKVTKAIFPVAGLGTRFLPATKSIPKEILTLVDRPLVQYAIDEARAAGLEEFIFVTARGKSALEDYFDCNGGLEQALERAGKYDLLAEVRHTNMASGSIAYVRQAPLSQPGGSEGDGTVHRAAIPARPIVLGRRIDLGVKAIPQHRLDGRSEVVKVADLPITYNGAARHSIQNAMAALCCRPFNDIKRTILY